MLSILLLSAGSQFFRFSSFGITVISTAVKWSRAVSTQKVDKESWFCLNIQHFFSYVFN